MGQLNALTTFITQLLTEHIGQFNFLGRRCSFPSPPS